MKLPRSTGVVVTVCREGRERNMGIPPGCEPLPKGRGFRRGSEAFTVPAKPLKGGGGKECWFRVLPRRGGMGRLV